MQNLLFFLLLAGCLIGCDAQDATDEILAEDAILGTWSRMTEPERIEMILAIVGAGTYDISYSELTRGGEYRINSNGLLVVRDDACGPFEGTYSLTFTNVDQVVILGLVEDRCQIRQERWRGSWRKVSLSL